MVYSAYGSVIESDVPLEGIPKSTIASPAHIQLWLAELPDWAERVIGLPGRPDHKSTISSSSGLMVRSVTTLGDDEYSHIYYADHTEFLVSFDGARIYGRWQPPLTLEDTLTYALGPILALALRRQGRVCLHASAVEIDGRAVLFVGAAGAGKSTTAGAMVKSGARFISDDICALDERNGRFRVHYGQRRIRLWPGSVDLLFGSGTQLPYLTPNWDKQYLETDELEFEEGNETVEIASICILGRYGDMPAPDRLVSYPSPSHFLMALLHNTHSTMFLSREARAHEFVVLGRLAQTVQGVVLDDQRFDLPISELVNTVQHQLALNPGPVR